ncbi:MAG: acyl carrier protein [Nitrospiraceae bacterium]|nr:MAG: acyl carrier protein [Nitrospiraceae bacterium]
MSEEINNVILDVLAKHTQIDREKVNLETRLNSIGVDSLMMVEIIFDLEERFDISIPDPEFVGQQNKQFETVADVVRVVKDLIEQQTAS